MTLTNLTVSSYFIFILMSCTSPSNEIDRASQAVSNSLEKSSEYSDNSIGKLYALIMDSGQKRMQLVSKADTLFYITNNTIAFIDSLKKTLELQDSSGNDIILTSKILVSTKTSELLKSKLIHVYKFAHSVLTDSVDRTHLDSISHSILELQRDKDWSRKYFDVTPPVAAITILAKFENDCKNSAFIGMQSIQQQVAGQE